MSTINTNTRTSNTLEEYLELIAHDPKEHHSASEMLEDLIDHSDEETDPSDFLGKTPYIDQVLEKTSWPLYEIMTSLRHGVAPIDIARAARNRYNSSEEKQDKIQENLEKFKTLSTQQQMNIKTQIENDISEKFKGLSTQEQITIKTQIENNISNYSNQLLSIHQKI